MSLKARGVFVKSTEEFLYEEDCAQFGCFLSAVSHIGDRAGSRGPSKARRQGEASKCPDPTVEIDPRRQAGYSNACRGKFGRRAKSRQATHTVRSRLRPSRHPMAMGVSASHQRVSDQDHARQLRLL